MSNLSKGTKIMMAILIVIILGLLSVTVICFMNNVSEEDKECSSEVDESLCKVNTFEYKEDDFSYSYGKVRVTGYINVIDVPEEQCYTEEECESVSKIKYVDFKVTETDSKDFKKYLKEFNDKDGSTIGLGCFKNNKIMYTNNSVYFGDKDFEINEEMTKKILASTSSKPITLDLEKLEIKEAKGAPACYSHMTYIKVAK